MSLSTRALAVGWTQTRSPPFLVKQTRTSEKN